MLDAAPASDQIHVHHITHLTFKHCILTCHDCVEVTVWWKLNDAFTVRLTKVILMEVEPQSFLQVFRAAAVITWVDEFHSSQKGDLERKWRILSEAPFWHETVWREQLRCCSLTQLGLKFGLPSNETVSHRCWKMLWNRLVFNCLNPFLCCVFCTENEGLRYRVLTSYGCSSWSVR